MKVVTRGPLAIVNSHLNDFNNGVPVIDGSVFESNQLSLRPSNARHDPIQSPGYSILGLEFQTVCVNGKITKSFKLLMIE